MGGEGKEVVKPPGIIDVGRLGLALGRVGTFGELGAALSDIGGDARCRVEKWRISEGPLVGDFRVSIEVHAEDVSSFKSLSGKRL